jgi:hypothetical protein
VRDDVSGEPERVVPEERGDVLGELSGGKERARVVGPGAREVVAKLGAAAAAKAGSNRSSEIS